MDTWPPKVPNTFCIAGDSTLRGLPDRSLPSAMIWRAFVSNRLPGPPLTSVALGQTPMWTLVEK
jgi:hypothetical protein